MTDFPVFYYNNATYATEAASLYPKAGDYETLPYYILNAREMDQKIEGGLRANQPLNYGNVTSRFKGNTSQSLMVKYHLGRCMQLLDRNFDAADKTLSEPEQRGAAISDLHWVLVDQPEGQPNTRWFGKEPAHTWCYYFEKADLARQKGDWQAAARLGDEAATYGFTARNEMEKLVFIEAYAHTGQWDKALEMSQGFNDNDKRPMLCLLWQRIAQQAPPGPEKTKGLNFLADKNICR